MAQSNKIKQVQKQRISPVQLLCGELLEIPIAELDQRIEAEELENPYLEQRLEAEEPPVEFETTEQTGRRSHKGEYVDYWFQDEGEQVYRIAKQTDEMEEHNSPFVKPSSTEDLLQQLRLSNIGSEDYAIGEAVIGSLDERGFFNRSAQAIADDIFLQTHVDVSLQSVERMIHLVRTFEPAGIGAKDVKHCLYLQLERMGEEDDIRLAKEIITDYWDLFYKREYSMIERKIGAHSSLFAAALQRIRQLNPFPAHSEEAFWAVADIEPDFIVLQREGEVKFSLNRPYRRHLKVSSEGEEMLRRMEQSPQKDEQTIKFLQDKIERARNFIEAYNRREETLAVIMGAIVEYQRDYFITGSKFSLRPMKYEDIKQITGFGESTVSRVANDKYVQTSFGLFRLKDLFSNSLTTTEGESVSSEAIRSQLVNIIDSEDKNHPFTDEKLSELLLKDGYAISRRTVAKYREKLGIPSTSGRKLK